MKRMAVRAMGLACFAWGLCGASVAQAQLVNTSLAGGGGGTAFTQECPAGYYLVGIQGRASGLVDSVRAVCARQNRIGEVIDTVVLASRGGSGGTVYDLRCPRGSAVVGLRGRSGLLVDRIQLVCADLNFGTFEPGNTLNASAVDQFTAGGTGGTSFSLNCAAAPSGNATRPARALRGRSGSFVDAIGLGCGTTTLAAIAASTSPLPDLRPVLRRVPFRVRAFDTVDYRVSLWNLGGSVAPAGAVLDLSTNQTLVAGVVPAVCAGPHPTGTFARCVNPFTIGPFPQLTSFVIDVRLGTGGTQPSVTLSARADPAGQLGEVSENNNLVSTLFLVANSGFAGTWESVSQHCRETGAGPACRFRGTLAVENPGTLSTGVPSDVAVYLSTDPILDDGDPLLTTANIGALQDGETRRVHVEAELEEGLDASGRFAIAVLDHLHAVDERDETNNTIVSEPIP